MQDNPGGEPGKRVRGQNGNRSERLAGTESLKDRREGDMNRVRFPLEQARRPISSIGSIRTDIGFVS